ncbi:hypothetical protein [Albimonas pacifica]|uniref:Uncharacterized protein n=1 Tax=Albimonas pacifica TaxID=1114924 RepID=A0A1I3JIX1_9RHOB|nr:hypothetical protein [Albimonas pacifica]SFI60070.1 hypothetical protein SAMN05216258_10823 [Albimonas pacifica]
MPQPAPPPLPPISDELLAHLAITAGDVAQDRASADGVALLCLTMPAIIDELRARRRYAARMRALAERLQAWRDRRGRPVARNVVTLPPPPRRPALGLTAGGPADG